MAGEPFKIAFVVKDLIETGLDEEYRDKKRGEHERKMV
jgi:hypothetical protein